MFYFDDDFSIESERINISNFGIEFEKRKNNEQFKTKTESNAELLFSFKFRYFYSSFVTYILNSSVSYSISIISDILF